MSQPDAAARCGPEQLDHCLSMDHGRDTLICIFAVMEGYCQMQPKLVAPISNVPRMCF